MPLTIPLIETRQAIKEMGSTGHHPVQFLCSDDRIWFCKYVLDEFLTSLPGLSRDDLFATLDAARPHWPYPPDLHARLSAFLWNAQRLARLEAEARTFFQHPAP